MYRHQHIRVGDPSTIYNSISSMLGLIRFEQMTKKEMVEEVEPLKVVPTVILQQAVERQTREDVKQFARCYTRMDEETAKVLFPPNFTLFYFSLIYIQANKCSECNTLFSARSEHDFCANTFFHPGYYCIFRKRWNCCDVTQAEGVGCTGRFHAWTPAENVTTESASLGAIPAPTMNIDIIQYRTI